MTRLQLGLRPNWAQFTLLVVVNMLVGGMLGQERAVLPLLAKDEFGLTGITVTLTFIVVFGLVKAATNLVAGILSDRLGRKPVLIAGWIAGIPVPLMLIFAPTWGWVVLANVLLGINQGLTWSTTVIMKIDLAGSRQRGLAMGINEAAGYVAVSLSALLTGFIAANYGLHPEPFYLGIAYAALGLGLSATVIRETTPFARLEAQSDTSVEGLSKRQVFIHTSFTEPSLSSASQAGLVNNLNDGMAWGLLPIFFAASGLSIVQIGILVAVYPAVWGVGQLFTGAWSDRVGRKPLIVAGMWLQAAAIATIPIFGGFTGWAVAMIFLGAGTALVYPALIAAIADVAHPSWRASAVGVYRLWRDSGFAVGALLTGVIADLVGVPAAIWTVAVLTALSAVSVRLRMRETLPTADA